MITVPKNYLALAVLVLAVWMLLTAVPFADNVRGVTSSGGARSSSSLITLKGTVGSIASHRGASAVEVQSGYWNRKMALAGCDCTPGDANNNGEVNILDIIYLIDYKFKGGPAPMPYAVCSGDIDCNCIVNILDIVQLIDYKFKTGPAPCDCSEWNGACPVK